MNGIHALFWLFHPDFADSGLWDTRGKILFLFVQLKFMPIFTEVIAQVADKTLLNEKQRENYRCA